MIKANIGTSTWMAFTIGVQEHFGLSIGIWTIIIYLFVWVINSFLTKSKLDFSAFINLVINGLLIDFWNLYVLKGLIVSQFFIQMILLLLGLLLFAFGIVLYIQTNFGIHPIDQLMVILQRKFGFNLLTSRLILDAIAVVFALFFKGPVSFGTIILLLLTGPSFQLMNKMILKFGLVIEKK
jgi:hypothetical protein